MIDMERLKIKTFPLKMSDKLNHNLKVLAAKQNVPLQTWIMEAITARINQDKAV
jgi:predicted HicB family RNase H-like nuclease